LLKRGPGLLRDSADEFGTPMPGVPVLRSVDDLRWRGPIRHSPHVRSAWEKLVYWNALSRRHLLRGTLNEEDDMTEVILCSKTPKHLAVFQ
jgi:hypothetical protein